MNDLQQLAVENWFGPLQQFEDMDDSKAQGLMKGIPKNFHSTLVYLLAYFQQRIKLITIYQAVETISRERERAKADLKRMLQSAQDPALRKIFAESIQKVNTIVPVKEGRPRTLDTYVIEICSDLAGFLWYYDLVPGKREKPSKDAVYYFMFDFIKACGHKWSEGIKPDDLKDNLKLYLQEIDKIKI